MHVPLVDLRAQHEALGGELERALGEIVRSSELVLGRAVERFELEAARLLGVRHAVGVSCGTDALVVALTALGVGPGDEVLTTPLSFFATVEAVLRVGARPRFADVDPVTLQLDPAAAAAAVTPRTRAILPVHLYGSAAPVEPLGALAARAGIPMIEDAAQAFGSRWSGRALGAWGALGCFSFFPAKVLGALGDAGLVITDDGDLAARCRRLRQHGRDTDDECLEVGGNFRLDALQAAALSVKLPRVPSFIQARRRHAHKYDEVLCRLSGLLVVPRHEEWNGAVYTVRVLGGRRDALRRQLEERGIASAVYYARPLHRHRALTRFGSAWGSLPESERAAAEVLSLPLFPEMTDAQRDYVVDALSRLAG